MITEFKRWKKYDPRRLGIIFLAGAIITVGIAVSYSLAFVCRLLKQKEEK